ncbi:hypothetical protein DRN63_04120 [Nanoarchaeota archaeon]|nr:MAG: hypothetical protein DRN63_04120 [Nanoarchaeota archaeon]
MTSVNTVYRDLRKTIPVLTFARKREVKDYLKLYNIDLATGEYRCKICGEIIREENDVGILINDGNSISLVCSKKSCMERANFLKIYETL